nr:MAG TPA: NATURAL KILLER CELL PROTEASE 1 (serine protease-inhibitor), protease substrate.2A [Crassvirales sp.]
MYYLCAIGPEEKPKDITISYRVWQRSMYI